MRISGRLSVFDRGTTLNPRELADSVRKTALTGDILRLWVRYPRD